MPVDIELIKSFSGANRGLFAGFPLELQFILYNKLVEVWPDQAALLSMLTDISGLDGGRKVFWDLAENPGTNSTPQPEITMIDEHPFTTFEPFRLSTVCTTTKARTGIGLSYDRMKKYHSPDLLMKYTERAIIELVRGAELNAWSGEENDTTLVAGVVSGAGFGVNTTGTALRPVAGTKYTTDIADASSRMYHRDLAGGIPTIDDIETMIDSITNLGGRPNLLTVDPVNKKRARSWRNLADRITYKSGDFSTEHIVDTIALDAGEVMLKVIRHNYPSRAIFAIDNDSEKIGYHVPEGAGIEVLPMGPRGDLSEQMVRLEMFPLIPLAPHCHGRIIDTAAA